MGKVSVLMERLGFAPSSAVGGESLELHRCPFGQLAERHSSVVCGAHRGLMQGSLGERGAPLRATRLEPFVRPGMCLARLAVAPDVPVDDESGR
jgi:predicted ArsR family transcriptional regulator